MDQKPIRLDQRAEAIRRHTCRPAWLRDETTQQDAEVHKLMQLQLMARYGIGGCARIHLTPEQSDAWMELAKGKSVSGSERESIESVLGCAIVKAYQNVIGEHKDCRKYFLGEHNERIKKEKATPSSIRLCLAREGEIKEVRNRSQVDRLLMTNTILLKSRIGKSLGRIGLIRFNDGTEEHAFLDFLPDARIGARVIVHRNIACEIL